MNVFIGLFSVIMIGYAAGRVRVCGVSLGSAGVMLAAIVFGRMGFDIPLEISEMGLICFSAAVGITAGPIFFRLSSRSVLKYAAVAAAAAASACVCCAGAVMLLSIPKPAALGAMCGAMTNTSALNAALEVLGDPQSASVWFAAAYPLGTLFAVLFVRIVPRLMHTDFRAELRGTEELAAEAMRTVDAPIRIDAEGLSAFALVVVIGMFIGNTEINLGGVMKFKLGMAVGAMLPGIITGHFGKIGKVSLYPAAKTIEVMREFGLMLFMAGIGAYIGGSMPASFGRSEALLLLAGAISALVPLLAAFWTAKRLLHMPTAEALGSLCGSMTSGPALGEFIAAAGSESAVISYAATYPTALLLIITAARITAMLL